MNTITGYLKSVDYSPDISIDDRDMATATIDLCIVGAVGAVGISPLLLPKVKITIEEIKEGKMDRNRVAGNEKRGKRREFGYTGMVDAKDFSDEDILTATFRGTLPFYSFWLCWVRDFSRDDPFDASFAHYDLEEAEIEAERLAQLPANKGKTVYLLECIGKCKVDPLPVVWEGPCETLSDDDFNNIKKQWDNRWYNRTK